MCKGCLLDGSIQGTNDYLDIYDKYFEMATHNTAQAVKGLKQLKIKYPDRASELHISLKRLKAIAKEFSSIRDDFLNSKEASTKGGERGE